VQSAGAMFYSKCWYFAPLLVLIYSLRTVDYRRAKNSGVAVAGRQRYKNRIKKSPEHTPLTGPASTLPAEVKCRQAFAKKPQKPRKTTTQTAKNHGREPPHPAPPSTPAHDPPPAETAAACITGGANATEDGGASTGPPGEGRSRNFYSLIYHTPSRHISSLERARTRFGRQAPTLVTSASHLPVGRRSRQVGG